MICQGVTIKGTGICMPEKINSNASIEAGTNTTSEWIEQKLGIYERRIVEKQTVSDIGTIAAQRAMAAANLTEDDIDMIVVATSSPERISPATACSIHRKLNFSKHIPSFDINAVCAGFVFAMNICAPMISSKQYKNILIIGTEAYSRITDWTNRNCVFFGDGAAAIILGQSQKGWLYGVINSNGNGTGATGFSCPLDSTYSTNPKEVWDAAVTLLPDSIRGVLAETNLTVDDIKMFFPHQASINMLKEICTQVGLEHSKIKKVMHKYGNIAGASIPIALHDALSNNEITKGDKILLTAVGSGWSWGSIVMNYE